MTKSPQTIEIPLDLALSAITVLRNISNELLAIINERHGPPPLTTHQQKAYDEDVFIVDAATIVADALDELAIVPPPRLEVMQ